MSLDFSLQTNPEGRGETPTDEARRQVEICNACRYCEGYCDVFPALMQQKIYADGDITQLANLCHNCRGCYYACQYTEPHEFALNLPRALAEARVESWERFACPQALGGMFHRHGMAVAAALVAGFAALILMVQVLPGGGDGFYAYLGHTMMISIFLPAFVLPLAAIGVGLTRYWREVGGTRIRWRHLRHALASAGRLRNLSGGQGQGCNFEKGDRFSDARRYCHQAVLYGFLLCFAATSSGTIMHYVFGMQAPYGFFSLPKLLGLPGGLMLVVGGAGLAWLKTRAEPTLGSSDTWGADMAFVLVLGFTGLSGLMLYAAHDTGGVPALLALHLGAVFAFFLLTPYSKMAHGFYRLAALIRDAQEHASRPSTR